MSQIIKIKLSSFDLKLLEGSVSKIFSACSTTKVVGPVPLPTLRKVYTVLRSPHVNKKARDQFIHTEHKRLLIIVNPDSSVVDALMKFELPKGVEVIIKV